SIGRVVSGANSLGSIMFELGATPRFLITSIPTPLDPNEPLSKSSKKPLAPTLAQYCQTNTKKRVGKSLKHLAAAMVVECIEIDD
ncbi:hypothetical protein Csa_023843, partial [Cucumis sativus]